MNDWTEVDEGWGRRSVEFATLSEPANCREYLALQQLLDIRRGDRVLDIACGAGLALELAALRGAECAGIDASRSDSIAVAQDRSPNADIRVGDMFALPALGGRYVRRRHQLSRDLGHHPRGPGRSAARAEARRPTGHHGLGTHQGITGRLGALSVPARE